MQRGFLLYFLTIGSLLAQENQEDELSVGIPTIPTIPDRVEILQEFGYTEFDYPSSQLRYHGDFQLTAEHGLEMNSNNAIFDFKAGTINLDGDVSIYNHGILQRGNHASYNLNTKNLTTKGLAVSAGPSPGASLPTLLLESGKFQSITDKRGNSFLVGEDAGITTHDVANPNFWLRADEIRIYPEKRITFRDLKIYFLDTPVLRLPYFAQSLNSELGYHFSPGVRTTWGAYLLNRYGILITGDEDGFLYDEGEPWLLAQILADIRTQKGIGTGLDLIDTRQSKNPNLTGLSFYYANDLDPNATRSGLDRGRVNEDRFRISLQHRLDIYDGHRGNTFFDTNLTWLSDEYFLEDFDSSSFQVDPDPDNTLSLLHRHPKFLAGLTTRLRLNDFHDNSTSSPEFFLDILKKPIFNTPLLYEGSLSAGIYDETLSSENRAALRDSLNSVTPGSEEELSIQNLLDNRGFNRFHTWHEFSLPLHIHDGIGLVPHAGVGYTSYWDIDNGSSSFDRTLFQAGVDFSLKFSKRHDHVKIKKLGINGLLHTFQPYANFTVLRTDSFDDSFIGIQRLTPTTEVRPIKVGRFYSLDELNQSTILRLGVRNNLFTKRDGSSHPWLSLDTYFDTFIDDPEFDREFSNLYNQLTWNPKPWVQLDLNAQFPITSESEGFSEYSINTTFQPSKSTEIGLRYRFLSSHPTLEDSSRIDMRLYNRLNERWGFSAFQRWELDDGTVELQEYSLHRDLGSWNISGGLFRRDNRIRRELGFSLAFTLKEFPSVSVPITLDNE